MGRQIKSRLGDLTGLRKLIGDQIDRQITCLRRIQSP